MLNPQSWALELCFGCYRRFTNGKEEPIHHKTQNRSKPAIILALVATMHLMYHLDESGNRIYTLKKETPDGERRTESAHPARFSPDDKFSRQRVTLKKRFGIYLPSIPQKPM